MNDTANQTITAKTPEDEFLAIVRRQYEDDSSDEKPIREEAAKDLRFEAGSQWDTRIKNERVNKGRPALTFSRMHTFVQQVSNEARQNKPQIKFVVADGGDQDTADVKEGMARHIQYNSDAQIAYETAVEYAAAGSFGYFGFLTDYVDEGTWDQELKVRAFYDPFAVYGILIPSCFGMEPQHAFVVEEMPLPEYKRLYPKSNAASADLDYANKLSEGWIGTDTVRIAEYWYIEHEQKEISRKNPVTGEEETRTVDKKTVKFCKVNGMEIIKGTETVWPGSTIPIIPVLGKQRIVDGRPLLFSVIRFQRDPQQLINAYKTRIAETLMTQPISPFFVPKGAIATEDEKKWARMNQDLTPFLYYKHKVDGVEIPAPTRNVAEPPIQGLSEAAAQEIDDMKALAGIFDASLGAQGNETSGMGILRRQQQSNITNMHFMDNLERAFKKGGLVIAEVMPKIYDSDRLVRILGEDEAPKIARINAAHAINGKQVHYKVGGDNADKHDVVITMGRAFSTKRMESFDMMTSVLQTSPNLLPMIGDIFFRNSDMAGADQLAERFKKMLPPNLQDNDQTDPATQAQALQAQLARAEQIIQLGQQHIQQLTQEREAKVVENQTKAQIAQFQEQSRQEIVRMQEATKIAVAQITASKDANQSYADRELKQYQILHDSAHDVAMAAQEHAHAQDMADQQHQQALEQGDQAAQNQAALAQQQAANQANGAAQ